MGARDMHADGTQTYMLTLEYDVHVAKSAELTIEVSGIQEYLYDNVVECQSWMLNNSNKEMLAFGDTFPERVCSFMIYANVVAVVRTRTKG
jgi:hypothetical protein